MRRERERGLREKGLGFEDGGVRRRRAWELVRREAIFLGEEVLGFCDFELKL